MSVYVFVIDGPDGAGKSTLINELLNYFNQYTSYDAIKLSPTGGEFGDVIKKLVTTTANIHPDVEKQLLLASTRQVAHEIVTTYVNDPKYNYNESTDQLEKSLIIFLDRWLPSYHVYQHYVKNNPNGVDPFGIHDMYKEEYTWLPIRHTFIFDANDVLLDSRLGSRDTIDKYENLAFQAKVREGYRTLVTTPTFSNASTLVDVSDSLEMNKNKLIQLIIGKLTF